MFILKDVDFSKLIHRNLSSKHILIIEYISLDGKKIRKSFKNDGKYIHVEGIKELTKARVGHDQAWKNVLDIVKKKMLVKNPLLDFDEVEEIDMYSINSLNNETLKNIYKNIENFANLWKKYRNILFVCGDYPGYGGAATNCDRLQNFFKERGHNTFAFYYNNDKSIISKSQDIWIEEKSQIKNIPFVPDLIITKSFFNSLNLKDLFRVPVIYCVGGIFPNSLDKYFYDLSDNEIKNRCNKNVIQHIKNSDFVFVNSSHTRDILKEKFNLSSYIFYSSFIQYYNKKNLPFVDDTFEGRKYEYGLIMSNFDRPIKNARESIEFLKDKKNVILIGQNSSQFRKYGFTCQELVKSEEMNKYYRQIKYIIQDSFYESCSNVRIETLFNGSKMYSNFYQLNSEKEVHDYLSSKVKNGKKIEIINYTKIEQNLNNLKNVNYSSGFQIFEDEDDYLNSDIKKIPVFTKPIKFLYEKENLNFVYNDYLKYVDNFNNYIKFITNTLESILIANNKRKDFFHIFLQKFNGLKKFERGIMFICYGEGYKNICLEVLKTYRIHTKLPILLYTDNNKYNIELYNEIDNLHILVINEDFHFARIIKTQAFKYSPFKETCYVDIDSECLKNFDNIFDFLKTYDICMQPCVQNINLKDINKKIHISAVDRYKKANKKFKVFNNDDKFNIYAGGLVFFKKNYVTKKIFNDVSYYWYKNGKNHDMIGWWISIFINKDILKRYNLNPSDFNRTNSKIIRSFHWNDKNIKTKINISDFIKKRYHHLSETFEDADFNNNFIKKSIVIIYDVDGWVFHEISKVLTKFLNKKYIIKCINYNEVSSLSNYDADLYFIFSYQLYMNNIPASKTICGKTSFLNMPKNDYLKKFSFLYSNDKKIFERFKKINNNTFYLPNGIDLSRFYKTKNINLLKNINLTVSMISSTSRAQHKGLYQYEKIINNLKSNNINIIDKKIIQDPNKKIIPNIKLINHFNNIDIFLCLSLSETGPQPCLEALACGRIIISTNVGIIAEIIKNGYNGFIINDRDNIEEISNIIIDYLNLPSHIKEQMSNNCIKSVEKHDWKFQSKKYETMFDYYFDMNR